MGLFKELLLLPLAPVRGVAWVVEQVADEADRQLYDPAFIQRDLLQLELDAEDGRLSPEEREREEERLMERLAESQARAAAYQSEEFDLG
ncbi:MAG TPA: gas vesicle protein GvpG [Solirubrobacteraceae bacterium]|nr:gas vesicle protein GvpG [Solirubrobacteraceae bacterium]